MTQNYQSGVIAEASGDACVFGEGNAISPTHVDSSEGFNVVAQHAQTSSSGLEQPAALSKGEE